MSPPVSALRLHRRDRQDEGGAWIDGDIRQRIQNAAQAAWNRVWDTAPMPDGQPDALCASTEGVEEQAADRYRHTVRDRCAEVGVDERDYWLADPEEATVFRPECLADQLAQIEADLDAARRRKAQEFWRTSPPF